MTQDSTCKKASKSSRHSKITGDFGETLVLYLLSKYGYESVTVDHTGIDLMASTKNGENRIGISVKSRSKAEDRPVGEGMLITGDNYQKLIDACKVFGLDPWISIVLDMSEENLNNIYCYLLHLSTLLEYYPQFKEGNDFTFSMSQKQKDSYDNDKNIYKLTMSYDVSKWMKVRLTGGDLQ